MMVALRTLQERVRKSAILLDKEVKNWERKVSIGDLDMASAHSCMAGQLKLWGSDGGNIKDVKDATQRGFFYQDIYEEYNILNRLWTKQIRKRRKADYLARKARKLAEVKRKSLA